MPCVVDKVQLGEEYKDCCLDYNKPYDCAHAKGLLNKTQCKFWTSNRIKKNQEPDIVERLRAPIGAGSDGWSKFFADVQEAANEIEKLRNKLALLEGV